MHCSVQGALQQTPSTQKPHWHWPVLRQGTPLQIVLHDTFLHCLGNTHSVAPPQRSAQALPSGLHMNGAHDRPAAAAAQDPRPSQRASGKKVLLPFSQAASPQTVVSS